MKKGMITIQEAFRLWKDDKTQIDYRFGKDAAWQPDPFFTAGANTGVKAEVAAAGHGRVEFQVRPKHSRIMEIASEEFEGRPPVYKVKPEWRSVKVAIRSVREALKELKDSISGNLIGLHDLESKVKEVEERFCGPREEVPTIEQLGDFPKPEAGQRWQAQEMKPGRKWVDLFPGNSASVATVEKLAGTQVNLKFDSGGIIPYSYKRFKETGEVVEKIRYRFRCIDRGAKK